MVEEHDDLVSADLFTSIQNQLDNGVKVSLTGWYMPWVDIVGLKSSKEEFAWSYIITTKNKVINIIKLNVGYVRRLKVRHLPMRTLH